MPPLARLGYLRLHGIAPVTLNALLALQALPPTAPSMAESTAQSSSYQGGVWANQDHANTASDRYAPWVKDPNFKRWN